MACSLTVQIPCSLFKNGKEASTGYISLLGHYDITDIVCLYQRVGKWQKQKVIFSVPVNQIIVEEMLKKTSHPELWEDDVLNTLLGGTA